MSMRTRKLAGAAAMVAGGIAAGVIGERAAIGRRLRAVQELDEPFVLLRGEIVDVITEDGVRLHVEVDEPDPAATGADAPALPIVFVHGYGLSQDCFHYQRSEFRGQYRLIFADQRAHGRSGRGRAERSTIDQLGLDLRTIIETVVPSGPVVLVGHSMGGMTILTLAGQDPDFFRRRVVGVGLLATTSGKLFDEPFGLPVLMGRVVTRVAPAALTAARRRQPLIEAARHQATDLAYALTNRYSFGSRVSPTLTRFVAEMVADTPVDVIAEYLRALQIFNRSEAVAVLEGIETLIMVGDRDRVTPLPHSIEIVRRAPHAEFVLLPDTGHMLMLERHVEVNQHLHYLLDRVRSSVGGPAVDTPADPEVGGGDES